MIKCYTCKHEIIKYHDEPCKSCEHNDWARNRGYALYDHYEQHESHKPTRFEQFREQTATIEGLTDFTHNELGCGFCNNYSDADDECLLHYRVTDADCKAGIKAYWEGKAHDD